MKLTQVLCVQAQSMIELTQMVDDILRQTEEQWDMQVIAERIGDKHGYGTFSQYSAILKRVEPPEKPDPLIIQKQIELTLLEMIKSVLNDTSDHTTHHVELASIGLTNMRLGMAR